MTNHYNHIALPTIDLEYAAAKLNEMEKLINNLKLGEIESDANFNNTLENIKKIILLKPVIFDKPKIIDHYHTEKIAIPTNSNQICEKQSVFIITVEIKFSGDCQVFKYKPKDYTISDISYVFQPKTNSILLEVETTSIDDKDAIINKAQKQMNLTYSFINKNNSFIEQWNEFIEPRIKSNLQEYRVKLINLYS